MQDTPHTPGPWDVMPGQDYQFVLAGDREVVARVNGRADAEFIVRAVNHVGSCECECHRDIR